MQEPSRDEQARVAELAGWLDRQGRVSVAVSGGVDSTTLACLAHQRLGEEAVMVHATSPAVPPEATARTMELAARQGWRLEIIDAGEFQDQEYLRNPLNRCYHCKTHLYRSIARIRDATIVSGTNLDDLADFRPGLEAARHFGVRHPYAETGLDKRMIRSLALDLGLDGLAALPASPCLSSRVETGQPIDREQLRLIHRVESLVRDRFPLSVVRCRVRRVGVTLELGPDVIKALEAERETLIPAVERVLRDAGFPGSIGIEPYRMGSAFLRGTE